MSLRFIIGRAGCGKTHHCLSEIRRHLGVSATVGPRLVLLVPEQASLQAELSLLSGEVQAASRAEVLSFSRLAFRIFQETGTPERKALSAAGRAMVLRSILRNLQPDLRYYGGVEVTDGFLLQLGRTLGELLAEGVEPTHLLGLLQEANPQDPRTLKLGDVCRVFRAYLEYLGADRMDTSQHLALARDVFRKTDYLQDALIWVDGFAGYTQQELLILRELAQRARQIEVTALIDRVGYESVVGGSGIDPVSVFAKTGRACQSIVQVLDNVGVLLENPLFLEPESAPRFYRSRDLMQLERGFACEARLAGDSAVVPDDVELVGATDRRVEVEYAVSQVCQFVRSSKGGARYRDVAIIVRDFEPYHDLLTAALTERKVPHFIDRRRSSAHHPLVELVRGILVLAAGDFDSDGVRLVLKTDLVGLEGGACDELENYVLAHGVCGRDAWMGRDWEYTKTVGREDRRQHGQAERLGRVNNSRRRLMRVVGEFVEFADSPRTGAAWADALRSALDRAGAVSRVEQWAAEFEALGEIELSAETLHVLKEVDLFLADFADALGNLVLDVGEVLQIVEAGLAQLTTAMTPPTVDQVLVGSIERSRHPEMKLAIVLGFNDGIFPLRSSEEPVLNDEDRRLLEQLGLEVGVTTQQRILDEILLTYVAFTRSSERLIVLYSMSDSEGKGLACSPFVQRLRDVFPGLLSQTFRGYGEDDGLEGAFCHARVAERLVRNVRYRERSAIGGIAERRFWNDVYTLCRDTLAGEPLLCRIMSALNFSNAARLSRSSVDSVFRGGYSASVSELETYAACPFRHFAEYVLRLKERDSSHWRAADLGTIQHAVLEKLVCHCVEQGVSFSCMGADELGKALNGILKTVRDGLAKEGELSAREEFVLASGMEELSAVIRAMQQISSGGSLEPVAAEQRFGFVGESSMPALQIDTPQGRCVRLRGVIDRIDATLDEGSQACIVLDYKRSRNKRLRLAEVYHGLALQLVGYLLVMRNSGSWLVGKEVRPIGAFYHELLRSYSTADHPENTAENGTDVEDLAAGTSKPRGILDFSAIDLLEKDAPEYGRGRYYSFCRKKEDGGIGNIDTTDSVGSTSFQAILDHVEYRIGELFDDILDGKFGVAPYRMQEKSPCKWCPMGSVCRFEFGDPGMRHLENLGRKDVLNRLGGNG